jgi:hypothetical protein
MHNRSCDALIYCLFVCYDVVYFAKLALRVLYPLMVHMRLSLAR